MFSGRRPDTVSLDMDIPVGVINKWWLQREDIRTQFEKYCAAQERDERMSQQSVAADKPGTSRDTEEEPPPDDKDEDFKPDEVSSKVDIDTDRRRPAKKKKKKEVELSPYKNRKRVELPTKEPPLPAKRLMLDEAPVTSDHNSNSKLSNIQNKEVKPSKKSGK